jgi:hypothetical protein
MHNVLRAAVPATAQPTAVGEVHVGNLPDVFAAACLEGRITLPAREASKIGFDQLPGRIRRGLGHPSSGDVWRLANGESFLYVLNYPDKPGVSPKICGVASDQVGLKAGAGMLDVRLAGDRLQHGSRTMQWLRPQDGYNAMSTTAGDFNVLQVNWLSEADRKLQKAQLRPFAH